jgi:hypothetical protein
MERFPGLLRGLPLRLKVFAAGAAFCLMGFPWTWAGLYLYACLGMRQSGCALGMWGRHDWEWFLPGWNLLCLGGAVFRKSGLHPGIVAACLFISLAGGLFYNFAPDGATFHFLWVLALAFYVAGGALLVGGVAVGLGTYIVLGLFMALFDDPPCPPRTLLAREDR